MAFLEIDKLCFGYTEEYVVEDISFSLDRGQIFCLFGPNGCGKTTLIDCIMGFNRNQKGNIILDSCDFSSYSPSESATLVSYVPQSHEKTFPFLVKEIVLMGRTPHLKSFSSPGKADRIKVNEALESLGIGHLAERNYTTLSGGETRLVMLARALAQDAPLILMDEPVSQLDMDHELKLLEIMKELVTRRNKSVIFSSHTPNHAFYFENRNIDVQVALMNEKHFYSKGTPESVLTEENIQKIYNIRTRIISSREKGKAVKYMVPVSTVKKKRRLK